MADKPTAVALIVAGSGEVSDEEVADLLNDAYPESDFEVDLIVPASKSLYTKAVASVVDWLNNPDYVYPVVVDGEPMTRASSKLGKDSPQEVKRFEDIFNPKEFEGWDQVVFLAAVPDETDETAYDEVAGWIEAADAAGIPVKNLAAGLDDVVLTDPEDATEESAPEPEPEPEKPARRSRAKKTEEPAPEPESKSVEEDVAEARRSRTKKRDEEVRDKALDSLQESREKAEAKKDTRDPAIRLREELAEGSIQEALNAFETAVRFLEKNDEMFALRNLADEVLYAPITLAAGTALDTLTKYFEGQGPTAPAETPEEPPAAPKRGRGRPRENFEVNEIYDEDEEKWIPRPKGRVKKGTQWRVRDDRDDSILDEGTA